MFLNERITRRKQEGLFRSLRATKNLIDFSSNDYLGFADLLKERVLNKITDIKNVGSTGSRLLTGNSSIIEALEQKIAHFHKAESALVFSSGYLANLALLSAIATRDALVLYDQQIHASIRDALVLSRAKCHFWLHNDPESLENRLKRSAKRTFVCVESVYSVDGSLAPLHEIASLCERYNASLIVDEAHATGVFKEGLSYMLEPFARVHTFGKALGVQGAAIVGSALLREFLINFSRPFIYTTAPSPLLVIAIDAAYDELQANDEPRKKLQNRIGYFGLKTPIASYVITDGPKWINTLEKAGFSLSYLRYPTVKKNEERLRLSLHAFNTEEEIDRLKEVLCPLLS